MITQGITLDGLPPGHLNAAIMPPMKAAEILEHPLFGHTTLALPPRLKGKVPVAKDRGGSLNIAYEVHGNGPRHLITVEYPAPRKELLTPGFHPESDKPLGRYSTSEMARDTLEVVDCLEWTLPRQLHVVGVSLGGMIAQELGYWENLRNRINMVSQTFTFSSFLNAVVDKTSGIGNTIASRRDRLLTPESRQFIPKSPDVQLDDIKERMFSQSWLDAPAEDGNFPTNGDWFAAMELQKRRDVEGFTRKGFICQAIAAGWHHKSPEQLKELADKVGRRRIQVLHGTVDKMITPPHGETLAQELGGEEGVTKIIVPGRGHVLHVEELDMYNKALVDIIEKTERLT
ncbi:MAG: hypothetical protein Q9170_001482 [Blastenia crenularia]